jgi:hypothetical protein
MGEGLGLMRSFHSLSGNWDGEVGVLEISLARMEWASKLTLRFLLANDDQAEAAVVDRSWTDSAMSEG